MTRTIEQILGLPPMNQFDLVASPMRTSFVAGQPPAENFEPWTHVPNQIPLNQGVKVTTASPADSPKVKALRAAWLKKKTRIFAGKLTKPDAEDPDTVNHLNWYLATGFVRPYPGESKVRPPSDFKNSAPKADLHSQLMARSAICREIQGRRPARGPQRTGSTARPLQDAWCQHG